MELGDLRDIVRTELDDTVTPPRHSDAAIDRALNNAVREACLRTRAIEDSSSEACSLTLVAETHTYDLDPAVMVVRAVHVPGRTKPLTRTTAARLDKIHPGWEDDTATGVPEFAVFDVNQKKLRFYPIPADAGTARLRVWRMPLEAEVMESDDDEPVLVLPDPEELKHWAIYELLNVKDAEAGDKEAAAAALTQFTSRFGNRPTAHELALWSSSPLVGTRMASEF